MKNFFLLKQTNPEFGYSGEILGTDFDLSAACPHCGSGAFVKDRLRVKIKPTKDEFLETIAGDFLISEALFKSLKNKSNKVNVNHLKKVLDSSDNELPYYYLTSKLSFPSMSNESNGVIVEGQCQFCKRDGHFAKVIVGNLSLGIKTKIITPHYIYKIENDSFLDQSDIFTTWECFGNSRLKTEGKYIRHFARPELLVSAELKDKLEECNLKSLNFFPITIEKI